MDPSFDNGVELPVQAFLKFDDHDLLVNVALQDLGFILVKEYMVKSYLDNKQFIEILPLYKKEVFPIYVYYPYQTYLDPKIKAFLDYFPHQT